MLNAAQIRRLLRETGLHPSRLSGQNFLVDSAVARASVRAAQLESGETVLEVGAGFGSLTEELLANEGQVIAVERDPRLARYLRTRFAGLSRLRVVEQDIFRVRLAEVVRDGAYVIVANLPYSITSLFLRNFLTLSPRPNRMVLLVQREVADRMIGTDGDRSLLTLLTALASEADIIRTVDRSSFWPQPVVQSALIRLKLRPLLPETEHLMRFARLAFAGRRKQLKNSLAAGLQIPALEVAQQLEHAGISPTARPQDLTPEEWRKVYESFVDAVVNP